VRSEGRPSPPEARPSRHEKPGFSRTTSIPVASPSPSPRMTTLTRVIRSISLSRGERECLRFPRERSGPDHAPLRLFPSPSPAFDFSRPFTLSPLTPPPYSSPSPRRCRPATPPASACPLPGGRERSSGPVEVRSEAGKRGSWFPLGSVATDQRFRRKGSYADPLV
jgi:hypothetical protein